MSWANGGLGALFSPVMRFELGPDGTLRAESSSWMLLTVVGLFPALLLSFWIIGAGDWAAVAVGGPICALVALGFGWTMLRRTRLEISPRRIRYATRLLRWSETVAARTALSAVVVVERRYEGDGRLVLYSTELRFSDRQLPSHLQLHQTEDLDKARAVATMLSKGLGCELREELSWVRAVSTIS
jgi:hypothetical protein